ncbi:hypothetical protein HG535_0C00610 [Zygotorulaspora mrakii]|uniref:triacylglycerol lipase n=1 Tax=Zygotorulaspora mrakii TaxID=42260 RepID=A0A7H9B1R7_ZYGMR|nr:uncharacterized protein HG535_0C00610 [Zygotorulaspora mrakii]QLG71712.1 hypothetical protein HG535_0C00610 [Zygotorulaspora mrakii]
MTGKLRCVKCHCFKALNVILLFSAVFVLSKDSNSTGASIFHAVDKNTYPYNSVKFTNKVYERLVYFSKISAVVSCISDNRLIPGKTLKNGGCPQYLAFCSDDKVNPTIDRTSVEAVLIAGKDELGTGAVIVDHGRGVVILSFRGSTTSQDWASDFEIYPVDYFPTSEEYYRKKIEDGVIKPCKSCKIHRGFNKFSKTLGDPFLEKVENIFLQHPDYRFVITGHSLGAALAIISGIEFKLRGFNPVVLTYANPKMFNKEMKEWVDELFSVKQMDRHILETGELSFEKGYFRVVHDRDYIPMLPPFYHSAGLEIFIRKDELPHRISDLEYKGSRDYYNPEDFADEDWQTQASGFSNRDWLHKKEHRCYFIDIAGCLGF